MRFEAQTITVRDQYNVAHRLPAMAQQGKLEWATDEGLRCLLYKGKHGEIRIPGLLWMLCDAAFAQGFWHGRAVLLEREDGDWFVLTDQEFTHLIAQELPTTLPAAAIAPWKRASSSAGA